MIELFAMNVPLTPDDRGYMLWLHDMWHGFLVPVICLLYLMVAAWLLRRSRHASTPHASSQPG